MFSNLQVGFDFGKQKKKKKIDTSIQTVAILTTFVESESLQLFN